MKKSKRKIDKINLARHDFLNYCKWTLISILNYCDENKLVTEQIHFNNEDDKNAFSNACESDDSDEYDWLINNGYKNELYKVYYKHLLFSLLNDFTSYFSVSVENAFTGNINVAWSLLRKPLQETLAYIEWLAVDKNELLDLMLKSNNAKDYEITNKKFVEKRKNNIARLYTNLHEAPIDMFEFRYSKDNLESINGILQAMTHLITDRNAIKTSAGGFNYIFPDKTTHDRNTSYYYTTIPFVMVYTMNIIMRMFAEIATLNNYTIIFNHYNLWLKNLKALQTISLEEAIKIVDVKMPIICPRCGKEMKSIKAWKNFAYEKIRCIRCFKKVNTFQYIFDFENITLTNENEEDNKNDKQT